MKPGFFEGAGIALIASLAAALIHTVSAPVLGSYSAVRLIIGILALGYVLYLLKRSPSRNGRLATLVMWVLAAVATASVDGLLLYAGAHLLLIWLVRSFNFYSSLLAAAADLGLTLSSLMTAVWAGMNTGSVFAVVWCALLVQAAFVFIPRRSVRPAGRAADPEDRFLQAYQLAEAAVTKLSLNP